VTMKTYAFIGSDKNAGKTTALSFFYRQLRQKNRPETRLFLTSIGINGESVDAYEWTEKPTTQVRHGSWFITAGRHLRQVEGQYRIDHVFGSPEFQVPYVMARAESDFSVVLEGPNDKQSLMKIKAEMNRIAKNGICLLDGSIDRQFIGHPAISDGICFSLLLTSRKEQLKKARDFLTAMGLQTCSTSTETLIRQASTAETRSILFRDSGTILYHGGKIPYLDDQLKQSCQVHRENRRVLYLKGALSRSLYRYLSPLADLTIVLHDFTCYQNISTATEAGSEFRPTLRIRHSVPLSYLFIKRESEAARVELPKNVPVINLYRDNLDDFRI